MKTSFFIHACVTCTFLYESCHLFIRVMSHTHTLFYTSHVTHTYIHIPRTHIYAHTHTHTHTTNEGVLPLAHGGEGEKKKSGGRGWGGTHAEPTSIFRKMANLGQFLVKFKALWQKSPQKLCTIVKKMSELIKTALFYDLRLWMHTFATTIDQECTALLSFAEYCLFYTSLLQKRPVILSIDTFATTIDHECTLLRLWSGYGQ